jgi:hypothetical protein
MNKSTALVFSRGVSEIHQMNKRKAEKAQNFRRPKKILKFRRK